MSSAIALLLGLTVPLLALPAAATPDGMQGSYVGVTIDPNNADASLRTFAEMGSANWVVEEATRRQHPSPTPTAEAPAPTQFQGRLDLPHTAVSLRGTVLVDEQVRAVMPTLTYDVPVSGGANVYAGAGYRFVRTPEEAAAPGDRSGAVLTTGVEAAVGDRFVVYGDAQMGLHRDPISGNPPVRLQMGIGHRF